MNADSAPNRDEENPIIPFPHRHPLELPEAALNQFDAIKELRGGKGLTEVWLSRQLSSYGVESRTIWIGEECAKGYYAEDLKGVFERYQ